MLQSGKCLMDVAPSKSNLQFTFTESDKVEDPFATKKITLLQSFAI